MGTGAGPAYWLISSSSRARCLPVLEIRCCMPALMCSPGSRSTARIPTDEQYPSSPRKRSAVSTKEKGKQMWCAMSRPSMLPLKYRTLRMRSQTKLSGSPVSSAVRGTGGRAIGAATGGAGAVTAISGRLSPGVCWLHPAVAALSYDRSSRGNRADCNQRSSRGWYRVGHANPARRGRAGAAPRRAFLDRGGHGRGRPRSGHPYPVHPALRPRGDLPSDVTAPPARRCTEEPRARPDGQVRSVSPNPPSPPRRRRAGLAAPRAPQRQGNGHGAGNGHHGNGIGPLGRRRRASAYLQMRRLPRRRRATRIALIMIAALAALGATTAGVVFAGYNIYKAALPDATTVANLEPPLDSYVFDSAGKLIYVYHGQGTRHEHIALANVSRWVKLATVDVEDRHFYTEGSWDLPRLVAAGVTNLTHSGSTQGASTITEQLAKLSLQGGGLLAPTAARSLDYKIKEIVLGNDISIDFSKDQILDMYLNRVYFGNQATGIATAAELYFKTS